MGGYHVRDITRGEHGQPSKIREELEEFLDSVEQENKIMALMELSDVYLSIRNYLNENHPGFTMNDLKIMADVTERVFRDGYRVSRD
jgi:chorismate mutase